MQLPESGMYPEGQSLDSSATSAGESPSELLSSSPDLSEVWKIIQRAAPTDATVLIYGENGTGKELAARAIHELSLRRHKSLISLNLAAVPAELAESVLFGHTTGAFTGATRTTQGYCVAAHEGTLFLDEIGGATLSLQSKLLRLIQNGEVQSVGSEQITQVDVRFIAAMNRLPEDAIEKGLLKDDLYHRLNVIQIRIPPLRERPSDLKQLTAKFFAEFNFRYQRSCKLLESAQLAWESYSWPGNVRQMRSLIHRMVILAEYDEICLQELPVEILSEANFTVQSLPSLIPTKEIDRLTFQHVQDVLAQEQGQVAAAAKRLGISKATLYRWLKRLKPPQQ